MTKDTWVRQFQTHKSLLDELDKAEGALEAAKAAQDRDAKRQAEATIEHLSTELSRAAPTLAFHWLRALGDDGRIHKDLEEEVRKAWQTQTLAEQGRPENHLRDWALTGLAKELERPALNLETLPPLSLAIQFKIELRKPYISRDDQAFYILDNPVRKDKLLQLPCVAGSSWKGALRSAARQAQIEPGSEARLFGTASDEASEEGSNEGWLTFFSTFFQQVSLEIINPHDRRRKVGQKPILFESAPQGSTGWFTLAYCPLLPELASEPGAAFATIQQDLQEIRRWLGAMFGEHGFGAKTSSGFGLAEIQEGKLEFRWEVLQQKAPTLEPEEVKQFREDYGISNFDLAPAEYRAQYHPGREEREAYQAARQAWQEYQAALEAQDQAPATGWWQREFYGADDGQNSLEGRIDELDQVLASLAGEEGEK